MKLCMNRDHPSTRIGLKIGDVVRQSSTGGVCLLIGWRHCREISERYNLHPPFGEEDSEEECEACEMGNVIMRVYSRHADYVSGFLNTRCYCTGGEVVTWEKVTDPEICTAIRMSYLLRRKKLMVVPTGWMKGFDPYAEYWCKHCGAPESITCVSESKVTREYDTDSAGLTEGFVEESEHVLVITYKCRECGAESDAHADVATESQFEAHTAFVKAKADRKIEESESPYFWEDEDYDEDEN